MVCLDRRKEKVMAEPKELTPEEEQRLARKIIDFANDLERLMHQHKVDISLAMQAMSMINSRKVKN
jgi:hypothetical protein